MDPETVQGHKGMGTKAQIGSRQNLESKYKKVTTKKHSDIVNSEIKVILQIRKQLKSQSGSGLRGWVRKLQTGDHNRADNTMTG